MKYSGKLLGALLAGILFTAALFGAAFGVDNSPQVVLKASGASNQYILRLEQFSSNYESVQFELRVQGQVTAPEVNWIDDSAAHFQRIDSRIEENQTVFTVYVDRLRPIANSGSTELAELTFSQTVAPSRFSLGSEMIALDGNQEKTVYPSPALTVVGPIDSGSDTSSSGDNGASGGSSGGSTGSISIINGVEVLNWQDVRNGITSDRLEVIVESGQVIGRDIFEEAHKAGVPLVLDYGDFVWTFHTEKELNLPATRLYYDLSVQRLRYKNLSAAVESTDMLQFEIAYSGPLPCEAELSCRVGTGFKEQTAYLSYYNEKEVSLDYQGTAQVDESGMVSFAFSHASKYVISSGDFWTTATGSGSPTQVDTAVSGSTGSGTAPVIIVPPENQIEDPEENLEDPEIAGDNLQNTGVSSMPPELPVELLTPQPEQSGGFSPVVIMLAIAGIALIAGVAVTVILRLRAR